MSNNLNFGIDIAFAFASILLLYFLFHFGIVRDMGMLWKISLEDVSIMICGDDMALTHDSNTKQ